MTAALLAWLVVGCSCGRQPPVVQVPVEPVQPAPATVPAGAVVDGVYFDDRYGFSLPVPSGWTARPGLSGDTMRLALSGPHVEVQVWVFPGGKLEPRSQDACAWTFHDTGPYRALPVAEDVLTATCTPDDPASARVYAYLTARQDAVYELEVHADPGALASAKEGGDRALAGLRW